MGGSVELDKSGRFYLKVASGSMEMHLVAEGLRKLATVARLVATGSLLDKGSIVVGTIQGAEDSDVGKTIDVTLSGDQAYSRDPKLPLLLIGFGLVALAFAVFIVVGYFRQRRAAVAAAGGVQAPDGGASGKWRIK